MQEIVVDAAFQGKRIDQYLAGEPSLSLSRSYIEKLLSDGHILLNGHPAKPSTRLKAEDRISVSLPAPKSLSVEPEDIPLDIVYEDGDILIINKGKGMVVHPSAGHEDGTLVNAVLHHCGTALSTINGVYRPGIVHRIDRDTTGLLVVCKNDKAHQALAEQLRVHSIKRRYAAIVHGNLKTDRGTVDAPISRSRQDRKKQAIDFSNGRRAVTHYQVLERLGDYSLLECSLETGRTHQIRVHLSSIGHPVLGDPVYGPKRCPFHLEGQCLHAGLLGFQHPSSKSYVEFTAPYPPYFSALLERLRERTVRTSIV